MKSLKVPRLCQWDITDRCNLHCKMCRNYSTKTKQSDIWKILCQKIIESGVDECSLAGGEPLMHINFRKIVEYLSPLLKKVNVLTNGTLIDRETATFLYSHNCFVQISIDGGNSRTHDNIRGTGNFSKTLSGIANLRDAGVEFATQLTITTFNHEEIKEFVQLSKKLGSSSVNLRRCIPVGHGKETPVLNSNSLKKVYKTAFEFGKKFGIEILTNEFFASLYYLSDTKAFEIERISKNKDTILGGCSVGWTAFYVRWDGSVMFCPYLPVKCGNILEQDFEEIWEKSKMYKISRNLRWNIVGKCSQCNYLMVCGGCPAATYNITGDILNSDPQCWI